jgi:hypothetical protein
MSSRPRRPSYRSVLRTPFACGLVSDSGWLSPSPLFGSPALATAYLVADESAPHGARTRAGAWVNTAVNGGSPGETATAGLLLGRLPLAMCFAVTALPVMLAAVTALILHVSTTEEASALLAGASQSQPSAASRARRRA